MIDELRARNVALIRDASIEPASGLTVLTGETGAGKTALLSSIKLLVGERSDAGMVREGSDALEVEGRLFLRGDDEDGTIVRRRVGADGRGRVELDGRMASVRELAARVGATVDLCGQHEHQRLLSVQTHVDMLDSWIGAAAAEALQVYQVALDKELSEEDRDRILAGVELSDGVEKADELEYIDEGDRRKLGIEIHSGKNRIVRRLFESQGYNVKALDRVYFAGLTKKGLKKGEWRFLTESEVNILKMGAYV